MLQTETHLVPAHLMAGAQRRLIVLVPSFGQTCADWKPLLERLKNDLPQADWLLYDHHRYLWSTRTMTSLAADIAAKINEIYENHKPYAGVTLIGHSGGGILLRKAYLMGAGHGSGGFDTGRKEWSARVDRIILFSALNRGFDPDRLRLGGVPVGMFVKAILLCSIFHVAREYMKGSSFLTDLRISWIQHFREFEENAHAAAVGGGANSTGPRKLPVVIQIRGAKDSFLREEDSTDVDQFSCAKQELLQGVGHSDAYRLPPGQEDERYEFLRHQIVEAAGDPDSPHTDPEPKHIVFLVHGIRSSTAGWPERAAQLIARNYQNAVAVKAGYSYFSALNFAIPFMRRSQIRWMQDQYAYRFAKHPGARFYFLGHSNGTYLLGRLLERVPSVKFDRVTLVGSVLPQVFRWEHHLGVRVGEYQNHRAAGDIPVGLMCSFLRGLGMSDIGTAGFGGFLPGDKGQEVYYYKGGHGAALGDEENLSRLIHYTLTGDRAVIYPVLPGLTVGTISLWSRLAPLLAIPILLLLAVGIYEPTTRWAVVALIAVAIVLLKVL